MRRIIVGCLMALVFAGATIQAQEIQSVSKIFMTGYNEEKSSSVVNDTCEKFMEICSRPEKSLTALEYNEFNISGSAWIFVYDMLGNVIFNQRCALVPGECEKINMKHLINGVYFLHITNGSTSITRKVVLD
jgi:hypothetical protein